MQTHTVLSIIIHTHMQPWHAHTALHTSDAIQNIWNDNEPNVWDGRVDNTQGQKEKVLFVDIDLHKHFIKLLVCIHILWKVGSHHLLPTCMHTHFHRPLLHSFWLRTWPFMALNHRLLLQNWKTTKQIIFHQEKGGENKVRCQAQKQPQGKRMLSHHLWYVAPNYLHVQTIDTANWGCYVLSTANKSCLLSAKDKCKRDCLIPQIQVWRWKRPKPDHSITSFLEMQCYVLQICILS